MWATKATKLFGSKLPVLLAPMAGAATEDLTLAVASAGGIAVAGVGLGLKGDALFNLWKTIGERTEALPGDRGPVGIGLAMYPLRRDKSQVAEFEQLLSGTGRYEGVMRPQLLWLSADEPYNAEPKEWVDWARKHGPADMRLTYMTGNMTQLVAAAKAGFDAVIAQSSDAGGHQIFDPDGLGELSTLQMINEARQALDREGLGDSTVLIAAGGIANGATAAAAFTLGADAFVMGSAYLTTAESTYSDSKKDLIVRSKRTCKTRFWDEMTGLWPKEYGGRSVNNKLLAEYRSKPESSASQYKDTFAKATADGDVEGMSVWCGTGINQINERNHSAADFTRRVCDDAEAILRRTPTAVLQ
eukprot:Clim_evm19s57 gene=Clim_evmTU19s57